MSLRWKKRQNKQARHTHDIDMQARHNLYTQLVRDHSADLYRFAFRWCGQSHCAEDLVAEAFTEAWKALPKLKDTAKARAWLFQILRRRCYRLAERRDRERAVVALGAHDLADHHDDHQRAILNDSLQQAIGDLDDKLRLPFLSVTVQGLGCREAAEELGIPLGTLLTRVRRAKQLLQEALADDITPHNIIPMPGTAG